MTTHNKLKAVQATIALAAALVIAHPELVDLIAGQKQAARIVAGATLVSAFLPALRRIWSEPPDPKP